MPVFQNRTRQYPVAGDPLQAQNFRTQRSDSPEDLWQPLYDRANCATTIPNSIPFFSTAKGQSATLITGTTTTSKVKTYRDTNMDSANVVPTKMFKFVGITMAFVHGTKQPSGGTNAADVDMIMTGGYLQFRIVDKDLLFLPLVNIPLLNTVTASTANNSNSYGYGGGPGVFMYKLPINITLNPYENFAVTLNFDTAASLTLTTTLDIYVFLQGFQRRPT